MLPTHRKPTPAGEMLLEEFLKPMHITQQEFSKHLGWTYAKLNEIIHNKRGISPASSIDLSDALGLQDPIFFINLQKNYDMWCALQKHHSIQPITSRVENVSK